MKLRNALWMSVLVLLLAAPAARADFFVSPLVGGNFAGDTNSNSRKAPFGVSFGYMGAGIVGAEAQLMYTPSFFGSKSLIGTNNVMSLMGNLIVGAPLGSWDKQIRPYVSGGVGLLRSRIGGGATDLFNITQNDFGMNIGAGAMGFFTSHVGLRGDVRYFRSLNGSRSFLDPLDLTSNTGKFNFWQATGGVAFKF
jgi:opacity protein-like surface antigen